MSAPGLLLASLVLLGAALPLAKPARYATDNAGVIPPDRLSALNEALAAFERDTSNQVVVYVDRRLPPDTTIEELAAATFRSWGIGQKGWSNGVLFLVFVDDRAMRVEVGYGLEGAIPDAIAKRITSEVVRPLFKKGDYAGGVGAGARALMSAARGEGYAESGRTVAETPAGTAPLATWALIGTFLAGLLPLLWGLLRRRTTGRSLPGIFASACFASSITAFVTAALTRHPWLWVLGGLLLIASVGLGIASLVLSAPGSGGHRTSARSRSSSRDDYASSAGDSYATSSSYNSSDSSSSSSSDFSGGGGDSGGGGSSDNW